MNVLKDIEVRLEYCHIVAGTKNELNFVFSSQMFLNTSFFPSKLEVEIFF